ncbi:gpW family head-tail joining protein [Undibacterium sp. SXout11W]|uniref:gpW family head-tail joining protein n=1 Tax=Undibacterium sp. SXout11W TaxID=3413050 RepID=UPI003BF1DBC5
MADLSTLQNYLAAAESALHSLQTGQQVVEFDRGGTKIRYTPAQVPQIESYIAKLRSQIAALNGSGSRRRVIYQQW